MASAEFDDTIEESAPVQVGDPFTEKQRLMEATRA
jgi:phosphoribosylformylglycinamidine (FGAM) synthase-like enzyme